MPVPRLFDIRRPSGASTVEWMITSVNGMSPHQLEPGPDHPVLPEPDDLARRRVDVAGVVRRELRRLVRPAERGKGPERRREPGVEHVRVLVELRSPRRRAPAPPPPSRRRSSRRRASSRRESGAPTRAGARCTSRAISPARRSRTGAATGMEAHPPLAERVDRGPRRLLHLAPPLQRDQRLDPRVAALAGTDRVPVALPLDELPVLLEPGDDGRSASAWVSPAKLAGLRRSSCRRARSPSARASSWSRPISKSSGSWPGVILSAPDPNDGLDPRVGDHRARAARRTAP